MAWQHCCRDVGLPRLTPLLRGLVPSHTIAVYTRPAALAHKSMTYLLRPVSV